MLWCVRLEGCEKEKEGGGCILRGKLRVREDEKGDK